jgi:hypothetical protein
MPSVNARAAAIYGSEIEQAIVAELTVAGCHLRFDRVVQWLVNDLKASLTPHVPERQALLITLTAPIKLPKKTSAEVCNAIQISASAHNFSLEVHGNQVSIYRLAQLPPHLPKVLVFVHNPETEAAQILDVVKSQALTHILYSPRDN